MKMRTILTTILAISLTLAVVGQGGKLKKADNYFERLSYAYAAEMYEQVLGSEFDSPAMQGRLAFSYFKMGETQKSIDTYAGMINSSQATVEDYYNYAYVLKLVGKYSESDKWMNKYATDASTDKRSQLYLANKNYKSKIEDMAPFFAIKNWDLNSKHSDFGGYYSLAMDEVYFVTARRNRAFVKNEWAWDANRFLDLFKVEVNQENEFGKPKQVSKLNTKFHEGPMAFSPDGKYVYYTRNNVASGKKRRDGDKIQNLKLYYAEINEKGKYIKEKEFPYNSKEYSVGHPTITADGKTMYLVSDMSGGFGGADLYKVELKENGEFGEMINLGAEINTEGQEMFPFIDAEGRLFFSTNGHPGLGGLDVFVAILTEEGVVQNIHNLGLPINSKGDDFAFTMSKDFKKGFISSNREGGQGGDDIYLVESIRPLTFGVTIKGKTKNKEGEMIPFASVDLKDEDGNVIATVTSNENGEYSFAAEYKKNYALTGNKEEYFEGNNKANTFTDENVVYVDVVLEKDPGISLLVIITDAKTGAFLEAVQVSLTDNLLDRTRNDLTPASGELIQPLYSKRIDDRGSYNIVLQKEGYFTKTVTHNIHFTEPGQYRIEEALDPMVEDLAEMIQINPINFDLNKYNIRPDAAIELDKIVEIMNKYPNMIIELGAHTDCRASKAYNMRLSDNRAKASAEYIRKGITDPDRIYGKGYGESRLLNHCECEGTKIVPCSEEEHAVNRRTEFRVISTGDDKVKVKNTSDDSF